MGKMNLENIAKILAGVGAANWGLVKFMNFDLAAKLIEVASMVPMIDKIVYGAIAAAGVYVLIQAINK